jgi:hypothetical protein
MNGPEEMFESEQERMAGLPERDLIRAFEPLDPPSGFADRVMARALAGERPSEVAGEARGKLFVMPVRQWRVWAAGAVAAVIVLGVLQGQRVEQRHEQQVKAQQEFEAAQRITDQTMQHTRDLLRRAGISLEED